MQCHRNAARFDLARTSIPGCLPRFNRPTWVSRSKDCTVLRSTACMNTHKYTESWRARASLYRLYVLCSLGSY